jgi:hypothetical protein
MDISSLSAALSQQKVEEEAAAKIQRLAIQAAEEQSAALKKVMDSAQAVTEAVTDPNLGNQLDLLA